MLSMQRQKHHNVNPWNLKKARKKNQGHKKTKFEEYVEMDMQIGGITAEELKWENELAKKLNVKNGLLPGHHDHVNSLFVDTDSDCESLEVSVDENSDFKFSEEEKLCDANKFSGKMLHEKSLINKCKKRKPSGQGLSSEVNSGESVNPSNQGQEGSMKGITLASLELNGEKADREAGGESANFEACDVEGASRDNSNLSAFEGDVKYVAPHLRTRAEDNVEYQQIRRRVRGLLNRLCEDNIESITGEICTIFRMQSAGRSVGSQIIIEEILASCSRGPRGNEQYAAIFAACIAGMACSVGIDFGAKLIASLAKSFEEEYLKEDTMSLRNLTLLLAFLCLFGVCSSDLIYDFLLMLVKRLTEVDVSTILTILKCCGMKLRGDDPTAMKVFVVSVQNRANELKSSGDDQMKSNNKRMEFMLEAICDIKNNKKRSKEDPAHHTRIKKWLQKLRVDDILIRGVTWSKLLDPNKRGQWWWSGDATPVKDNVKEVSRTIDKEVLEAQKLLELAAAQRMNTDTRRAIFCIIMSGEDYVDAFEKLLRLDLPGKQDREIIRVLVECCLQEKVFNKYYCILASKLCSFDKKHKFTLQYCVWDHLKEVESMQLLRVMHLSTFIAHMLSSYTLSLSVLKTVEFTDVAHLAPKRIMLFRMLFDALFEFPETLVWNIFTRIAVAPDLELLRSGIRFFLTNYVAVSAKCRVAKKALDNLEGVVM